MKISRRMCIGCRGTEPQEQLVRLVLRRCTEGACACGRRAPQQVRGHAGGRSAYVHERLHCVQSLGQKGKLEHAYRASRGELCSSGVQSLIGGLTARLLAHTGAQTGKKGLRVR